MPYKITLSKKFKQNYKKLSLEDKNLTDTIIQSLASNKKLEKKYKDHALKGNYIGFIKCHIKPDLLLIYRKNENILELYLAMLAKHNKVF